jgi:hypothetical protein
MKKFITRFFLLAFALAAFIGPFAAVMTIEKSKQAEKLVIEEQAAAQAEREAAVARYQYYLEVADRKGNLKDAMAEAKTQYEALLKAQPDLIKAKQTTVSQTVIKPVTTQKVVTQTVPSTTTSSKPKSSTKTKTS